MPHEDSQNKIEVEIANLESEVQTPEVQETIAELRASLEKEVEESVAQFKEEDNKVEEIEKSVNLSDPQTAENIEKELQIDHKLEDLDEKARVLKEEVLGNSVEKENVSEKLEDLLNNYKELESLREELRVLGYEKINPEYLEQATQDTLKGLSEVSGVFKKVVDKGLNFKAFENLKNSINPEDKEFFNSINNEAELTLTTNIDFYDSNPDTVLKGLSDQNNLIKEFSLRELMNNQEDSIPINSVLDFISKNKEIIDQDMLKQVENLISNQKDLCIYNSNLSIDKLIEILKSDPLLNEETNGFRIKKLIREESKKVLDEYASNIVKNGTSLPKENYSLIENLPSVIKSDYIDKEIADEKLTTNEVFELVKNLDIKIEDLKPKSLQGVFVSEKFSSLSEESKAKITEKLLKSEFYISPNKITEYLRVKLKDSFVYAAEKQFESGNLEFLKDAEIREVVLESIIEKNNIEDLKNIKESFYVLDNREKLPSQILETLEKFEDHYGSKGRDLIALAISAYGTQNPERFADQMESIEKVLNKYDPGTVPEGMKVSMGIEYEVTDSVSKEYSRDKNTLGYKKNINLISESANIGKGRDAFHELAFKPNYNPYMVMAEVKLLQDGGFMDFNFEKYTQAARGYHLSLVGDSGLDAEKDVPFLNNVMTMAQLTGITAGKEVERTKIVSRKTFEHFSDSRQKGDRCEIKGMATDSVEQFEKAIITAHHAGIAIQVCNKYIPKLTSLTELGEIPETAEEFESLINSTTDGFVVVPGRENLNYFENEKEPFLLSEPSVISKSKYLNQPFESEQERNIAFEWLKLKSSILEAVEINNKSFVDSEFNGYVLKDNGEYIDTAEHIDIARNKKLIGENGFSENFKDKISIKAEDLFNQQGPKLVNALTNINNIFLKPPKDGDNSPVNATSVLDTMKQENYGDIMDGKPEESIFENGGEFRDGYYYTQGASEEMIIHKSQILLNHFNKNMDKLLQTKGVKRTVEQEELVTA